MFTYNIFSINLKKFPAQNIDFCRLEELACSLGLKPPNPSLLIWRAITVLCKQKPQTMHFQSSKLTPKFFLRKNKLKREKNQIN